MAGQPAMRGLSPVHLLASAAVGFGLALIVQAWLSARGRASLVLPYSLAATLVLVAVVLIVLALRLRRQLATGTGAVNPFQAVRLLATARAAQIVGAVFFGVGAGLLASLIGRAVPALAPTWLPMLVTAIAALVLLVCALITEHLCRIPPSEDPDADDETGLARLET